jgi:AcrR family transcriptional regulator
MADSKKQILQTALKLFLKNSYKEVSLRDIVKEVGLTKGAFYHYYTSKDELFREVVKYFYNHMLITDYHNFPRTSLKEFYEFYLKTLQEFNEFDDTDDYINFFIFISDASKRVSDFLEIHTAQRKKELRAWTEIIEIAKRNKEIKTNIPDKELAAMFLNMSDGAAMDRAVSLRDDAVENISANNIKTAWDNLYNMLKTAEKSS